MVSPPFRGGGANESQLRREYPGGSVGIGRVWQSGHVKSEFLDKEREILVFQVGGWALGSHPNPVKNVEKHCSRIDNHADP